MKGVRGRRRIALLSALALVAALVAAIGGAAASEGGAPALPVASLPRSPGIAGLEGPWKLVFSDTFSGRSLDPSLWHTCYGWGCTITTNPEDEWYQSSNVAVSGGHLSLTARRQPSHGRGYTSGMIQSNGNFDFRYGVVEVRAKVPVGTGTWPAIWLVPANQSWPPEIDVMEFWGQHPDQIRVSLHYGSADHVEDRVLTGDFASGWHTYAIDWEPASISWYVDGQLVFRTPNSVNEPMYPIVNLAVASSPPPLASTFPATFEVSSIRVFQHPGVGGSSCRPGSCLG